MNVSHERLKKNIKAMANLPIRRTRVIETRRENSYLLYELLNTIEDLSGYLQSIKDLTREMMADLN